MKTGLEDLDPDHPLRDVWHACIEAGHEMNLQLPEAFALHVMQYIRGDLLGEEEQ